MSLDPTSLRIWLRYEIACEDFDRTLPGVWDERESGRRVWRPFDVGVSQRVAYGHRRDAHESLRQAGIGIELWEPARRHVTELTYEKQRELLAHLEAAPNESVAEDK